MITDQMINANIGAFLKESNKIEGIGHVKDEEIKFTYDFICLNKIELSDIVKYVSITVPHAVLRDKCGLNVRVGNHIAPKGGVFITKELDRILWDINNNTDHPYLLHHEYETLHPFTDGNGRSGRLIWLWQMEHFYNGAPLGFLHQWYYQSLDNSRSA